MAKPRVLTAEREAELARLFADHSNRDLAARFGINVRQVQHIGHAHGLLKSAAVISAARRARDTNGPALTVRVEQAVSAAGPAGLGTGGMIAALPGVSPSSITGAVNKLTADRRIYRAGSKGKSRWFSTLADAQAFDAARTNPAPAPTVAASVAPTVTITAAKGPGYLPGEPIVPPGVTPQEGHAVPGPDARWHANAARHFAGRIGRYDADAAPSLWARAVTNRGA